MLSTYSSQIQSVYEKCRYRESFMFTLYVNTLKMGNPEIAFLENGEYQVTCCSSLWLRSQCSIYLTLERPLYSSTSPSVINL